MTPRLAICTTIGSFGFLLAGCADSAAQEEDSDETPSVERDTGFVTEDGIVYPGADWPKADPESVGMDSKMLEKALETAKDNDSHCLLVTRGGRIITEWYDETWDEDTEGNLYSVTKSLTSLVVGRAVQEGLLDIDEPAQEFIPAWAEDGRRDITIRHLLSMTSGLSWTLITDFVELSNRSDMTLYATELSQDHEPGSYWQYSNAGVQALDAVLSRVFEEPVIDWAETALFGPIGAGATFSLDPEDNTILFSEARASCRDLARIGYLVLRNGKWGSDQLIDAAYLDAATTSSSTLNEAYGHLFWLNTDGHWIATPSAISEREEGDGSMWPAAPEHIIMAKGLQAQLMVVDKENDLVFSRIGGDPNPVTAVMSGKDWTMEAFTNELLEHIFGALNTP